MTGIATIDWVGSWGTSVFSENTAIFFKHYTWILYFDYWTYKLVLEGTYEPPHDKTNKMTYASSEDADQPGRSPSLIRVFAVRMKKAWVCSYPFSALWRLWSDWADAQAHLSLCWAHRSFCWFCCEAAHIWFWRAQMSAFPGQMWLKTSEYSENTIHLGRVTTTLPHADNRNRTRISSVASEGVTPTLNRPCMLCCSQKYDWSKGILVPLYVCLFFLMSLYLAFFICKNMLQCNLFCFKVVLFSHESKCLMWNLCFTFHVLFVSCLSSIFVLCVSCFILRWSSLDIRNKTNSSNS